MEYVAIAKNIKISPRKMRLLADEVKKQKAASAIASLTVMNKRAANPLKKAINSALANAKNNFGANTAEVSIKEIIISEGLALKRFHFAARGRVRPYKRRASHIKVILADNRTVGPKTAAQAPKVEAKAIEAKVKDEKAKGEKRKEKSSK